MKDVKREIFRTVGVIRAIRRMTHGSFASGRPCGEDDIPNGGNLDLVTLSSPATTYIVILLASLLGMLIRFLVQNYTTSDTGNLLLWYDFARLHNLESLRYGFTNYTPFYSYWLLIATKFHGVFKPLLLIKAISFAFEFGCAILAFQLVK